MEPRPRSSRRAGDRGATLVEYALMVSLIALVCAAGIGTFEEESSARLSDKAQNAGAPDVGAVFTPVPPGSVPPGSTTTTPPAPPPPDAATAALAATATDKNQWSATVTVEIRDGGGAIVPGALVEVIWNHGDGQTDMSCATDSDGQCPMTLKNLMAFSEVTFTIMRVSLGETTLLASCSLFAIPKGAQTISGSCP